MSQRLRAFRSLMMAGWNTHGGVKKKFKAFEPDAVMLGPPSLDEWLPQNHLSWFIAELVDDELDFDRFYATYAKVRGQPP